MSPQIMLILICVVFYIITLSLLIIYINKKSYRPIANTTTDGQVSLQYLQSMTPMQISNLPRASLNSLFTQYYSNFNGIPEFPGLQSQLSPDQYNAFYTVYSGGKVY